MAPTEPNNQPDITTIRAATDGDRQAFEVLFHFHYGRVYRTVFGMLGNDTDARETTQRIWIKAWQNRAQFNFKSAYTTWLHRIAVNTALDELRRRKRYWSRFKSIMSGDQNHELPTEATAVKNIEHNELYLALHQAISKLPEAQRTALVLKEFENYTYEEIAATLNCKIGTVMSRLHLARKKLQSLLTKA